MNKDKSNSVLISEKSSKASNAWLVRLGEEARLDGYVLTSTVHGAIGGRRK